MKESCKMLYLLIPQFDSWQILRLYVWWGALSWRIRYVPPGITLSNFQTWLTMLRRAGTFQTQPRLWSPLSPPVELTPACMKRWSFLAQPLLSGSPCGLVFGPWENRSHFKVRIGRPFTERQVGNITIHGCSLFIKHVNSLDILLPGRKGNTASIHGGQAPCRWGCVEVRLDHYHKTKPGFKFLIQYASAYSLLKLTRESKYNVIYLSVASKILCKVLHGHGAVCYLRVFNSYFLWSPAMSSAS